MDLGFLGYVVVLLVWASLGSVYWRMRRDNEQQLERLKKIEKRLAAIENKLD